eukprot:11223578-Lingulodinium_polyedra.AAC.1
MGARKVPGLDNRFAAEFAALPDELLEWVCRIFDLVEDLGRWPGLTFEGILLPKPVGDPAEPMDRRPVWLWPMLNR